MTDLKTLLKYAVLSVFLYAASAAAAAERPSVEEMAAQMLMVGFRGTEAGADSPIVRQIRAGVVGNVILFDRDQTAGAGKDRNVASPEQLKKLIAGLKAAMPAGSPLPLWVAVDQEGGKVQRLRPARGFLKDWPSAESPGRDPETTRETAKAMGTELADLGIDLDFAPVADVNVNPNSPAIGALGRSFSADPEVVVQHAVAFGEGLLDAGVFPCLKHFPGHGSAREDTHEGAADVTTTWDPSELLPYRKAFAAGWRGAVMTAHIFHSGLDSDRPASLSVRIVRGLLRGVLGWQGVVVTDDLQMGALAKKYTTTQIIRMAVEAGADILVFSSNARDAPFDPDLPQKAHAILVDLVRRGVVSEDRLYESWQRIAAMKEWKKDGK